MIIREWRARALKSREGAYLEHFNNSVLPQLVLAPRFERHAQAQAREHSPHEPPLDYHPSRTGA
jgi:hypothetical protein